MSLKFKSFTAADRKRNMTAFGMFPSTRDLSWIADTISQLTPAVVTYSSTPVFDLANGNLQRITLTGNVSSSTFVLNGGSSIPDGTMFYLQIIQDATGNRTFAWPTAVRNGSALAFTAGPSTLTSFAFEYRNSGWDFFMVPVEGPSS